MEIQRKYILSGLILLQCLTVQCSNGRGPTIAEKTTTMSSSGIQEYLDDTSYFKASQLILLETNTNSLLKRISRICSHDNKLFVFDQRLSKVIIFDMKGNYLTHICRIGNGPTEYVSLMDICLDTIHKQIVLLCDRPYKFMRFKYSGEFVNETKIKTMYVDISSKLNYIYCTQSEISSDKYKYELICMDSNYNIVSKLLPLRSNIKNHSFIDGKALTSTLNIYYTRRFDNTIYHLNGEILEKKYVVDFKINALPPNIITNINTVDIHKISRERKYVFTMVEVCESENYLMFKTNLGNFVFNKSTHTLNGYKTILNSRFGLECNTYFSIANNHQMIVSPINASYLYTIKEYAKNHNDREDAKLSELLKIIGNIQEDDNPALLLFEFK